eukprot:SAG11_NODE_1708_length_4407_cov_6.993036_2_plen_226_part_00
MLIAEGAQALDAGESYDHVKIDPGVLTGQAGTNTLITSLYVDAPSITPSGATITETATVFINGYETDGTTNYGLLLRSASARVEADDATAFQLLKADTSTNVMKIDTSATVADIEIQALTVSIEDNAASSVLIQDVNDVAYMLFTTTDDAELITMSQQLLIAEDAQALDAGESYDHVKIDPSVLTGQAGTNTLITSLYVDAPSITPGGATITESAASPEYSPDAR